MDRERRTPLIRRLAPYAAFALTVLGAKFLVIAYFGNATPYWDQWDVEANDVYRPSLDGSLRWGNLFSAHNEHRLFCTRVLAWLLFVLNGQVWNPLGQMAVNALLHVCSLAMLLFCLNKALDERRGLVLSLFSAVLFSIPFDLENTLWGFQSQFYFLILFSILSLWSLSRLRPLSVGWWLGLVCGGLCTVSMASGVVTLAAGAGLLAVRAALGVDRSKGAVAATLLLSAGFLLAAALTPSVPRNALLGAHSASQWQTAFTATLSWPADPPFGIFLHLPLLWLMARQLHRRPPADDPTWFLFAMGAWLFGQFAVLCYGRASDPLASRYLDVAALGLVLNFASVLLWVGSGPGRSRLLLRVLPVSWLIFVALGFSFHADQVASRLLYWRERRREDEYNVRGYLAAGEFPHGPDPPPSSLPYPDALRLKSLLDNGFIRSVLPPNLTPQNASRQALFAGMTNDEILGLSYLLLPGGVLLYAVQAWRACRRAAESLGETHGPRPASQHSQRSPGARMP